MVNTILEFEAGAKRLLRRNNHGIGGPLFPEKYYTKGMS